MQMIGKCYFEIGDVIDHKFTVQKSLGEGSFGKVFSVQDDQGYQFALKLLKLWEVHPDIREVLVSRFDMEYETGRINSHYLVHSVNHGFVQGNPYIVMEYCSGGDLIHIQNNQSLDYAKVATHVLQGLGDLHKHGKVHRDLKPENVLLKNNGNFALTDFGISGDRNKRMTERNIMGRPKQLFGTYAYMPPEQLSPRKDATVLPTTDIFSFGVMMYQLLTGKLPFGCLDCESDLPAYIKRGKEGNWDKQTLKANSIGHDWYALVEGCLEPNFTQRLQTVKDVLRFVPNIDYSSLENETIDYSTNIKNGVLLRVMHGEEYGKIYKLDDLLTSDYSLITMGRSDYGVHNTINIMETNSQYVSRKHCTFELDYQSGDWVIRDGQWDPYSPTGWKKSTNGTYVNSKEVTTDGLVFKPGDIISIGDIKFRVEAY